jgi:quercetin dioxygenase-like cupin family protein
MKEHVKAIDEGKIVCFENEINAAHLTWNAHPKCKGVSLKHLITGKSTNGQLSCHLVRIEAGCEISEHVHADNLELHEILSGHGKGILVHKEIPYLAGTSVVIPANELHKVTAEEEDIYLLAKFTPALI